MKQRGEKKCGVGRVKQIKEARKKDKSTKLIRFYKEEKGE